MMYNTTFISYLNNSFTLFITDFIYLYYEKRTSQNLSKRTTIY